MVKNPSTVTRCADDAARIPAHASGRAPPLLVVERRELDEQAPPVPQPRSRQREIVVDDT